MIHFLFMDTAGGLPEPDQTLIYSLRAAEYRVIMITDPVILPEAVFRKTIPKPADTAVWISRDKERIRLAKAIGMRGLYLGNGSDLNKRLEGIGVRLLPFKADAATDEKMMREALRQARRAAALGEVPIGCVIAKGDQILARAYNRRNTDHTALGHAEIAAIGRASRALGDWRLSDCTLYVTLEPCPMCAGAMVQARLGRAVIGAMNPKAGCAGSVTDLLHMEDLNHRIPTTKGCLDEPASELLKGFFERLRRT